MRNFVKTLSLFALLAVLTSCNNQPNTNASEDTSSSNVTEKSENSATSNKENKSIKDKINPCSVVSKETVASIFELDLSKIVVEPLFETECSFAVNDDQMVSITIMGKSGKVTYDEQLQHDIDTGYKVLTGSSKDKTIPAKAISGIGTKAFITHFPEASLLKFSYNKDEAVVFIYGYKAVEGSFVHDIGLPFSEEVLEAKLIEMAKAIEKEL